MVFTFQLFPEAYTETSAAATNNNNQNNQPDAFVASKKAKWPVSHIFPSFPEMLLQNLSFPDRLTQGKHALKEMYFYGTAVVEAGVRAGLIGVALHNHYPYQTSYFS